MDDIQQEYLANFGKGLMPEKVLIVDDDEVTCKLLAAALENKGCYETAVAYDGVGALQRLEGENYSLVLLDIDMPGMNGVTALQKIRSNKGKRELPVIMVSARDQSAEIVEAFNMGANDYVTKPLDMEVLLARIRAQLV